MVLKVAVFSEMCHRRGMAQSILIIEDDPDIAELISYQLKHAKYMTEIATDGERGLKAVERSLPAMVILDLMLPGKDGIEICQTLKKGPKTKHIPILMVTAKGEEGDRITGFEVGADDYLPKPFSPRELVLRVQAIFKRMKAGSELPKLGAALTFGALTVDPTRHEVSFKGNVIPLTLLEFRLLYYLMERKGKVADRDTLLNQVWGYDPALTTRTVDTHVKRLRQKLGVAGEPLETVRGLGYRWRENE
jgi:two-component system phosphate regulon response regulator PhoB